MRIAEQFKPQKIILFGSYAYGKPRYPGPSADRAKAKDAVERCKEIRTFARQSLGLKV